ncbi:Replication factor C subunit [Echinococcus granulosus]|uniref:Replication factor C subunit 1 n=1 Tax=Echinococcus granulosus TaxID=6210 RepID=W6UHX8_ECHGR|nr:Replication factor C subunit [Echinococcus granulosus]EUB57702.1 Replication factor C subunit [Echinococcus granulosus]
MPDSKRGIICDDSSSESEFQSPKLKRKHKRSHTIANPSFTNKEMDLEVIPKKRTSQTSKRKIPTFEEGEAGEDPYQHAHRRSPKRRKSIFALDLGDTEAEGPRGKVQLTFEESLRKAEMKKKARGPSKSPKTLHDFFSVPKVTDQPKKESKRAISVDDFFASLSHKTPPQRKEPVALVPETPTTPQSGRKTDDDEICLSASMVGKPLMPSPALLRREKRHSVSKVKDSPVSKDVLKTAQVSHDVRKEERPSTSPVGDSYASKDVSKTPPEKRSKDTHKKRRGFVHKVDENSAAKTVPETPPIKTSSRTTTPKKKLVPSAATPETEKSPSTITPKQGSSGGRPYFWKLQNREGPQALGSRLIPKNTSTCFANKTFVITGVLECIEREEAERLIQRGGGRVTQAVSKRTSYLVVGRDSGASKLNKAVSLGTPQLTEEAFFDLVDRGFGKVDAGEEGDDNCDIALSLTPSSTISGRLLTPPQKGKKVKDEDNQLVLLTDRPMIPSPSLTKTAVTVPLVQELWVEKYRPRTRKELVGQNGAASPANRLYAWLSSWQEDYATGRKAKSYSSAPPWAVGGSSDTGAWARAALLSGPPGVGKTSTASVVCAELNLATIEMNASDTRSKRSLQEEVVQALDMRSLSGSFDLSSAKTLALTSHVLIMDEVDGMAGNEDRGGMLELIGVIKTSKVPVICLCNDRQSPKWPIEKGSLPESSLVGLIDLSLWSQSQIRSLANYCLDLRFHRPRVEQIKAAVLSMACREGVNVSSAALNEIISASNHDLRQVINSVQMWCMNGDHHKTDVAEADITANAAAAYKNLRLGPFEVIRKVFATNIDGKPVSFTEAMDLFFQDYSLGPLFVQENYLNVRPVAANGNPQQTLDLLAEAAVDIAQGDIVSRVVQSTGGWSLLPTQAVFASLRPGRLLRGSLPGGPGAISSPAWFGRNSTQTKNTRLLAELSQHMRLSTHGGATDSRSLLLDYLHPLAVRLSAPLKEGDINSVLECLDAYQLLREDMDSLVELTTWQGRPGLMKNIDAKVKSALTRTYNKSVHKVPYATELVGGGRKKRRKQGEASSEVTLEEGDEADQPLEEESEESSVEEEEEIRKLARVVSYQEDDRENVLGCGIFKRKTSEETV